MSGSATGSEPSTTAGWLRGLGSLRGDAPPFDPASAPDEPVDLFLEWLRLAVDSGVAEAHAATLATVGADGAPDARTLLLKDVDAERGWAFAGPTASLKAEQLAAAPAAALAFWWQPLVRAVRVRGPVEQSTAAEIAADLAARPAAGALRAADWMLWRLRPTRIEFWQGAPSREHVRLVYERDATGWTASVVAPRG
jgi:pyridoxamine 5'-phosphate oxidase